MVQLRPDLHWPFVSDPPGGSPSMMTRSVLSTPISASCARRLSCTRRDASSLSNDRMACETDVWDPEDWPPSSIDCDLEFLLCSEEIKRYAIFPNKPLALTIYLILGDLAMNELRIDPCGHLPDESGA